MEIVHNETQFNRYINEAVDGIWFGTGVLLTDTFKMQQKLTLIVCATVTNILVCGIMEHIEEAGIHSGDSACVLPAHGLFGFLNHRN